MNLVSAEWPLFGWITDVRSTLEAARTADRDIVLGTLISTEGPSPRPIGAQMVFDGETATGYLSGGCLEADVANHAALVLANGEARHLVYGKDSPWIDIRLTCGGRIDILLERIRPNDLAVARLISLRQLRKQALWTSDGQSRTVHELQNGIHLPEIAIGRHYSLIYEPRWRVAVVGGDPIALAIANLATLSGFETTILRPDGPTTPPPIEGVSYCRDNLGKAIDGLHPDEWTAIVTATHDDDLDDHFIKAGLIAQAGYVGVLGSASRLAARRTRLLAMGLNREQISKLYAPIGAVRCGKAPWEIATSVIADIMQARINRIPAS